MEWYTRTSWVETFREPETTHRRKKKSLLNISTFFVEDEEKKRVDFND